MGDGYNDTSVVMDDNGNRRKAGDNEYYGILIVAAVFFVVFALASSVYLRQRRMRMEAEVLRSGQDRERRRWNAISGILASSRQDSGTAGRGLSPRRDVYHVDPLDFGVAPPAYDDLPPSYEDSIKHGVVNMGFSSDVEDLPPSYSVAVTPSSGQNAVAAMPMTSSVRHSVNAGRDSVTSVSSPFVIIASSSNVTVTSIPPEMTVTLSSLAAGMGNAVNVRTNQSIPTEDSSPATTANTDQNSELTDGQGSGSNPAQSEDPLPPEGASCSLPESG